MPNLMNDIIQQSDTLTSIRQIRKDAAEIYQTVISGKQNVENIASNMSRNNHVFRQIQSWLKGSSDSLQSSDDLADTEFDSYDDPEKTAVALDSSSYSRMTQSKMHAMYQIASKQIEAKIQNTAEIISVVDHRASEVVAGLNQTDVILKRISSQLDQLISTDQQRRQQVEKLKLEFLGKNGELKIENFINSYKQMRSTMVKQLGEHLKAKTKLGVWDRAVNEKITEVQNKIFRTIFNIPWIKKRFNPFESQRISTDYTRFVENRYDKKPAVFDNITRKTIIDIIPEYLKHITTALTGQTYHISDTGQLTTQEQSSGFGRLVEASFSTFDISSRSTETLVTNVSSHIKGVSDADVYEMQRALVSQYIYRAYKHGERIVRSDFFKHGGDQTLHAHVAQLFSQHKGGSVKKWMDVIHIISTQWIMDPRYAEEFSRSIIRGYKQLDERAKQYAKTANFRESLVFTQDMFDQILFERAQIGSEALKYEGKTLRDLIKAKIIDRASLTQSQLMNLDQPAASFSEIRKKLGILASDEPVDVSSPFTYQSSWMDVFDILNRGINVYIKYGGKDGLKPDEPSSPQTDSPIVQPEIQQPQMLLPTATIDPTQTPSITTGIKHAVSSLFNQSNDDSETTSEVMAGMNAAVQSGEPSNDDETNLTTKANSIKDQTLRGKIVSTIKGVFNRFGTEKKSHGIIGKALLAVFGVAKGFFSKIFNAGKTFLTKAVSWFVNNMKSAFNKITTGARSIKEGFTGSEESIGIFGRVKGLFSRRKKKRKSSDNIGVLTMGGYADMGDASGVDTYTIGSDESESSEDDENEEEIVEQLAEDEEKTEATTKKPGFFSSITSHIKQSGFGQGFSDAMKKSRPDIKPKTVSDAASEQILDTLKTDSKKGLLAMCGEKLGSIRDTAKSWIDQIITSITGKSDQDDDKNKQPDDDDSEKKDKKEDKGLGYDIGKILGGATKIFMGIGQAMMTVIAGMSGFKAITSLINGILKRALKPLDRAFKTLLKALKPTVKTIQKVLTEIVQYIVEIAESVITIIQPILEAIGPLVDQLLEVLTPIMNMISDLLNVLMVPLVAIMQSVVVPLLQTVANALQMLLGVVQIGMGLILSALGGLLVMVGTIAAVFTHNDSLTETGAKMWDMGTNMVKSGAKSFVEGIQKEVALVGNTIKGVATQESAKIVSNASKETKRTYRSPSGSAMEGIYGSGDDDQVYAFSDTVQESLSTLKDLASQIISIFTGESDSVEAKLATATKEQDYQQLKLDVSRLSEEEQQAIDDAAFEQFKAEHPKYEGETDQDYRARYEQQKTSYWMIAATDAVRNNVKATAGGTDSGAVAIINNALGEVDPTTGERTGGFTKSFAEDMLARADSVKSSGLAQGVGSLMTGGYSSGSSGQTKEDLIRSAAMIYEGYLNENPYGTYMNGFYSKPIHMRDGTQMIIRPDCSGIISAAIHKMGYNIKNKDSDESVLQSYDFAGATSNTLIYDQNGNLSSDWQVLPYSKNTLERGDITALPGHVGLPITNLTDSFPKGLDGGGTENIVQSAAAATAYLNGESNIPWRSTLGWGRWNSNGGARTIWRYVGQPTPQQTFTAGGSGSMTGTLDAQQVFSYLVNSLGMSPIAAAGMMGCFHYESDMRSNNLENTFEKKYGTTDEKYTAAVDSGKESEHSFVHGRTSAESEKVGYGIAQFTASDLKQDLYNRTVRQGKSIADTPAQLDAIVGMLQKRGLYSQLNSARTPTDANKIFLWKYEAGTSYKSDQAVLNAYPWMDKRTDGYANAVVARHQKAEDYYRLYGSGDSISVPYYGEPSYQESIYDELGGIVAPVIHYPIQQTPHMNIPEIDYSKLEMVEPEPSITINRYISNQSLLDYVDEILTVEYDIESSSIKQLVEDIFTELPDYLDAEDEDDDEFTAEDDYVIQQLASVFM